MGARTTTRVTCDGARCRSEGVYIEQLAERGWSQPTPGFFLCKRCSSGKCSGTVGRRPYWMGVDQWDPCLCVLRLNHDGKCRCEHGED